MEIRTDYMTKNGLYNPNRIINVKGLILHSVGCAVDQAEAWWSRWNKSSYKTALVHGFIDDEKAIIAVPCMVTKGKAQKAYHVANDATHNSYLGFEMCEYGGMKYLGGGSWDKANKAQVVAYAKKTYKNAVTLFAKLCQFHGLNPLGNNVILSHHEAHLKGMASNHGDVEHIWNYAGLTMNQFRKDVKAAMSGSVTPSEPEQPVTKYIVSRYVSVLQEAINVSYGEKLAIDKSAGPDTQEKIAKHYLYYKRPTIKNAHVSWLQESLNKLGAELKVDGSYGPATKAAVEKFQKVNGLTVDGFAGVKTHLAILKKLE